MNRIERNVRLVGTLGIFAIEVALRDVNPDKVVDAAYEFWEEMRDEIDETLFCNDFVELLFSCLQRILLLRK